MPSNRSLQDMRTEEPVSKDLLLSRRKVLASLGVAGAAMAAGSLLPGGPRVFAEEMEESECQFVATTIAGLRTETSPNPGFVYYVMDSGQEGYYYYDSLDTVSTDNTGTVVVSTLNARFKRIHDGVLNVRWFGAKGDGATDDTAAIQAAVDAGATIFIPPGEYHLSHYIFVRKPSIIYGAGDETLLKKDEYVFALEEGLCHGSKLYHMRFETMTTPISLITRWDSNGEWRADKAYIASPDGLGYAATVNDADYTGDKSQFLTTGIASAANDRLEIYGITGKFVCILLQGGSDCDIHNNNFIGGKSLPGSICLWQPGGRNNRVQHNTIKYGSFNGICLSGQYDAIVTGNHIAYVGESGIKTYQNDEHYCYGIVIENNITHHCVYDGFDLSMNYPHTVTEITKTLVNGNRTFKNGSCGYYGDGLRFTFTSNKAEDNGTFGISLNVKESVISNNYNLNNNLVLLPGYSNMKITGENNSIIGNISTSSGMDDLRYNLVLEGTGHIVIGNDLRDRTGLPRLLITDTTNSNLIMANLDNGLLDNEIDGLGASFKRKVSAGEGIQVSKGSHISEIPLAIHNRKTDASEAGIEFINRPDVVPHATARVFGRLIQATPGSEQGALDFHTLNGGTLASALLLGANGSLKLTKPVGSLPAASSAYRGMILRREGGPGVADGLFICQKKASGSYTWKQIDK